MYGITSEDFRKQKGEMFRKDFIMRESDKEKTTNYSEEAEAEHTEEKTEDYSDEDEVEKILDYYLDEEKMSENHGDLQSKVWLAESW